MTDTGEADDEEEDVMGEDERSKGILSHDKPSPARMYDYFLGGYNNFEVDRVAARRVIEINPDTPLVMQSNRAFLRRTTSFLARQGIDQFLDLGSGIPTAGNVHEVAQRINSDSCVAYVDTDPVAVHYSRELLKDDAHTTVVQADARQPENIVDHPEVRRLLDFDRPVAVLLLCLLHFVSDDDKAYDMVRYLTESLSPGSYVAISQATSDEIDSGHDEQIREVYSQTDTPVRMRSYEQIHRFFDGLELVEPGLVWVPEWRPEDSEGILVDQPVRSITYGGIGYKR